MSKPEIRPSEPPLGLGFSFAELRTLPGLERLDALFLERLRAHDAGRHAALLAYRQNGGGLSATETSELLLACSPLLDEIVAEVFGIEHELKTVRDETLSHDPVFQFKKEFVLKRARRRLSKKDEFESFAELDRWLIATLAQASLTPNDRELAVAKLGQQLLQDEKANTDAVDKLARWCVRALTAPEGKQATRDWTSFRLPQPREHEKLVPIVPLANDALGRVQGPPAHFRRRDGFGLTDRRAGAREALAEINYCIYCHDHDGDFCSKGFPEKKGEPDKGLKVDPLGVTLTGCPLDEKISEMHSLKRDGHTVAALAMIMADNPMCPATGHRICNDCMKACIYQKQDPVNIPQTETRCLTDVLTLPWGVEIYDLLTRWNPLRARQWLPKPYNGLKVLVCGMGPAGFTLSHHLLMEGFAVVGTEGLKIEPLPQTLIDQPVRDWKTLEEELDKRVMTGFGGVAEYGITVRWDKNFLKLIYLSLLRRPQFQIFGGVRFGGTVTVEDAWTLGFDHVAIAVGAGLPQALPIPGSLARGMRQANDFLMALQLTGAAKMNSLANLQLRLPAVVIGGGLTGIDTATEAQAYYIVQVEKTLERYEKLVAALGETKVREGLDDESLATLDEYLSHGRAVRAERARAVRAEEAPNFVPLLQSWGGVTVAYRRSMHDSPAYTRNHEEITKAFEEGIYYAEALDPKAAKLDRYGHIEAMVFHKQVRDDAGKWRASDEEITLPVRAVLVATGARPNVAYEFEHKGHFAKEKGHYQTHRLVHGTLEPVAVNPHCKDPGFGAFTSYQHDHWRVSIVGDTHPVFNGSVVKAVASGQKIYPKIVEALGERVHHRGDVAEYGRFRARMQEQFSATVESVKRVSPSTVELTVRAPLAAKRFKPGQFFRLQNFETRAPLLDGTRLLTEALALAGAKVDAATGRISLMVTEYGASARLVATLQPGEPVLLMGPTGVRTRIAEGGETTLVIGGRRAAATLLSVGPAMRAAGNRVLFAAGFENEAEIFCRDELEAAADTILWVSQKGTPVTSRRPQDRTAQGDLLDALAAYAANNPPIKLEDVDRLLVIGNAGLVRRVRDARRGVLGQYLSKNPVAIGSAHSAMQCMLKGVCSQCLQWQIDPATGLRTKAVFACSWQDEPIDIIDLDSLDERLAQNRLQEHLTNLWLDHLLEHHQLPRV
ncbi:MAG: pyridine nucleotide-disulfide oxidoreductase [Gammaproteobacteria bacterium]|nr:MAG: pyridine nucleotide-disulfide oxidoreductase [Gammaproteobacteria bacterium]